MDDHADFRPAVPRPIAMEVDCPYCDEAFDFEVEDRDNGAWYRADPEGFGGGEWHSCPHCSGLVEIRPVHVCEAAPIKVQPDPSRSQDEVTDTSRGGGISEKSE